MTARQGRVLRALLATLPPLIAFLVQWLSWPFIRPYAWFLFYPAVFLSSWLGGFSAGVRATVLSTALVWWFFVPPVHSLAKESPSHLVSAAVFVAMGLLFSHFHGRLRRAFAAARSASEEVTRLYEKTKDLDRLKSQFFANVSHELRTPLALVLGPTEKLLATPGLGAEAQRDLGVVLRNARALLRQVDDLLDLARLDAGRTKLAYAETDIAGLVRFVADHFGGLARDKEIALVIDAPESLAAQTDPDKLQRILVNLLANAFKFTPDHGQIRITLRERAARLRLEVADSGPGVPPSERAAVFERFHQVEAGPTRRFGGTGLGLAIVHELATLLAGSALVSEAPEGGALFVVELPARAPAGAAVRPAEPVATGAGAEARQAAAELQAASAFAPPTAGRGALALVVEDNREMNRFIAEGLARAGYRVAVAFDGREGHDRALELRPDVIVTDIMMPHMSGDELVRALRQRPQLDGSSIVVLTAKADEALRIALLQQGAQDYLTKPFSLDELLARVGNLVALRRAEAESAGLRRQLEDVAAASLAVSEAVAGLPDESVAAVLKTIALQAQSLTGAEYAAVGVGNDPDRPFDPWVYVGVTGEEAAAIGRPPRPVGLLGLAAGETEGLRVADLRAHPAHRGLPAHHPLVTSFLGVPIRYRGRAVGSLYLGNKRGAAEFSERDQRLVVMLAARVGAAIETARLYHFEGMERTWLQAVVDQMPEAVVLVDAAGRVTTENRAFLALASAPDHEPLSARLELRRPSGERLEASELPATRALIGRELVQGVELVVRTPEGRSVPVLVSAAPIHTATGEIGGATMILQDVSVLKELEQRREEWASIVAHELRQPINAIMLMSELLLRGSLTDAQHERVSAVLGSAKQLGEMVSDLTAASLLEVRRLALRREPVDLGALAREVVTRVPGAAPRARVCTTGEREPIVRGDPGRLEEVIGNLVSNALKYADPESEITIAVGASAREAELSVTNRGPGIPPDELPSLFERYVRTRRARKGRVQGLGLGLYITKGLVEAHGGRIRVESVVGEMTSFHVTLPLESAPLASDVAPASLPPGEQAAPPALTGGSRA